MKSSRFLSSIAFFVLQFVMVQAAWAQVLEQPRNDLTAGTRFALGYVANVPNTYLGAAALYTSPKFLSGAGIYVDFKFSPDVTTSDPYFVSGLTADDAELTNGDVLSRERTDWVSVNLAFVYLASADFALYGGGGFTRGLHYKEFFDDTKTLGLLGFYWVSDPRNDDTGANFLAGFVVRAADLALIQMGIESRPVGVTVGILLPFKI